jgi:uncharacterized protein (TIGR02246 family)
MWSLSGSTIITRSLHAETDMRDDRQEISDLIRAWVSAVRAGDLEGVLSAHAEDIVMFDVPSPDNGVRGIDAYRETWPPFFGWLRSGASFDIVELDVTAGDDVAYAWALLRCGTEDEFRKGPDNRLRLTIGLRRDGGRWVVSHEHHSFPDNPGVVPSLQLSPLLPPPR